MKRQEPAAVKLADSTGRPGEEALRLSEARLSRSQAMAHVGDWEWDLATNRVHWSDEVYRIYGYEPREVEPDYALVLAALQPESKERFLAAIDAALKGERPFEIDYAFLTKGGSTRTVHTIGEVFRDDRGRPVTMVGTVQDITAQLQSLEGLQRGQDLLTRAEKIAGLGSWEWDIASRKLSWSEGVFRIYGLDPARTVPSYELVVGMVHPAYRTEFLRAVEATLGGGQPFEGQYCLVRPDGSVRFTHTKGELLCDAAGKPVKMAGVVQDITESKRSETFIQDILETVDEGFLIIDRDYQVLSANRAYALQAGLSLTEIIGKKCYSVSHGLTRPCHEAGEDCAVRRVFETGEPSAALHTHHDAAGNSIYVETKAFPMTDPTGQVSAAIEIVNNITERKRLEEQYRQAQKMEAVALLAGGVAHDFNNMLTAISGYGHLLSVKLGAEDPLRGYAEQILAAAERAANLTQSLMAFGRRQVVNPVPVDLNEVVGKLLKLLHRVIGEDVELVTDPSPERCTVFADPSQIEQVLMNLATNARDAMPGGGVLRIQTGKVQIDEKFRRERGFGEDGVWATLRVSDTGTGMDERTRERIFEPFFTTKELGRGTGLGLASVYGIVTQSKGHIAVESAPGRGSAFSIFLPIAEPEGGRAKPAQAQAAQSGSETVLLAEDDALLRDLLSRVLDAHGYTVIEAANGEEAIDRFTENRESVDALILDMIMPKKNGLEAHAAIERLRPGIRTLFISGYSNDLLDLGRMRGDRCHFIAKPVTPPALLNKVREILDGV